MAPFTPVSSSANTHPYKTNVVIMETGLPLYEKGWAFAGMDIDGYPYLMMAPDALKNDTVVPHALGHAVQFAQSNNSWRDNLYLGPWYETIANCSVPAECAPQTAGIRLFQKRTDHLNPNLVIHIHFNWNMPNPICRQSV